MRGTHSPGVPRHVNSSAPHVFCSRNTHTHAHIHIERKRHHNLWLVILIYKLESSKTTDDSILVGWEIGHQIALTPPRRSQVFIKRTSWNQKRKQYDLHVQLCSSLPLRQSLEPSHVHVRGMQMPGEHWNWESRHGRISDMRPQPLITLSRVQGRI